MTTEQPVEENDEYDAAFAEELAEEQEAEEPSPTEEVEEIQEVEMQPDVDTVRQELAEWQGRKKKAEEEALEVERKLVEMQAEIKANEGAEEEAEITEFAEDYPEINQMVDIAVKKQLEEANEKIESMQKEVAEVGASSHYDSIYSAHPDVDAINESLHEWVEELSYKDAAPKLEILKNGSAKDVVSLISEFKSSGGYKQPTEKQTKKVIPTAIRRHSQQPVIKPGVDHDDYDAAWEETVKEVGDL